LSNFGEVYKISFVTPENLSDGATLASLGSMSCPVDDSPRRTRRYSMRRSLFPTLAVAALLLNPTLFSRVALASDAKIDLSGRWTLNEGLSDDPFEKMREAGGGRGSRGGGGGEGGTEGGGFRGGGFGRGGGGGSRGGFGGRGGGGGRDGDSPAAAPNELLQNAQRLLIVQKDPELRITAGAGKERLYYLDGRKVEEEWSEGTVKIRTKQKGETVLVDTEYPSGREVVQTYEVLRDVRRLVVTTKISGGRRGSFSFRRVYDPVIEPTPAPTPSDSK
jgi:hypothetical protein